MNNTTPAGGQLPPSPAPSAPVGFLSGRGGAMLRGIITMSASGLFLACIFVIAQVFAPEPFKPGSMIGQTIGTIEATIARFQAEDKAREAELIAEGQRRAEIEYQAKLKILEADYQSKFHRIQTDAAIKLKAFDALFEQYKQYSQAAMSMESQLLKAQTDAVAKTQVGRNVVSNVTDVLCAFEPAFCGKSEVMRREIERDLLGTANSGRGEMFQKYMKQFPNPAREQAKLFKPFEGLME